MTVKHKGASGGLSAYLSQMGQHQRLTRQMEVALARRARRGDGSARRQLIVCNLPLVVSVAKKFAGARARLDDLVQEGNIGLLCAADHYDPRRGTRFATYAVWWIRAYVQRYAKEIRSHVRGGGVERGDVVDVSLDVAVDEDGETTRLDRLCAAAPTPEEEFLRDEHAQNVRRAMGRVKRRLGGVGWEIVQERLSRDSPRTLEDIGRRWGISRERVRQLELRTKTFLSHYLASVAA